MPYCPYYLKDSTHNPIHPKFNQTIHICRCYEDKISKDDALTYCNNNFNRCQRYRERHRVRP